MAVAQIAASKHERASHPQWVRLGDLIVSERAQAEFRHAHANAIAKNFSLEALGYPVVSHRGGRYYIVDGQHRVAAARIFGFWPDDMLQCEVYEGLDEPEEARLFLGRNFVKPKTAWEKYKVALVAGNRDETEVDRAVRSQGLHIASTPAPHAVACVATIMKAYARSGSITLGKALRLIRDAFGDGAYEAAIVDALTLVLARYSEAAIDERDAVERLSKIPRGLLGLKAAAERTRLATSHKAVDCIASVIVEYLNRGRASSSPLRLAPWFKQK